MRPPIPLVRLAIALLAPAVTAGMSVAAVPRVVTDIAPVHSLVARVMEGVGEPALILPPGASPHDHALKPSESSALDRAGLVFWIGPALEPWLEKPLSALAGGATIVTLADAEGVVHLPARSGATFEAHQHDEAEGADHDHGHTHDHAGDGDGGGDSAHDHGQGDDPHLWLDPRNARAFTAAIAAALERADPENAARYADNAKAADGELAALEAQLKAELAPVAGTPFIVFHDAYQYFEHRFGLSAAGSISLADGAAPGPGRLLQIKAKVHDLRIACAFREPQFDPRLIDTVFEGSSVHIGLLDPLGAELTPGPALYSEVLRRLAASFRACKE